MRSPTSAAGDPAMRSTTPAPGKPAIHPTPTAGDDPAIPRSIYVLTGPTAVGKTEVSLQVAGLMNAEIVSANSMAIYRGMDAATAKPSIEERRRVPHHLIDIVEPDEPFSVADYRRLALAAIDGIRARGRRALVVGGTRLYSSRSCTASSRDRALMPTYGDAWSGRPRSGGSRRCANGWRPPIPRARRALAPGPQAHDPRPRSPRATGRTITDWQEESRTQEPPCAGPWVALTRDRAELYERIDRRVDEMIAGGLVAEVEGLLARGTRVAPGAPGPRLQRDHRCHQRAIPSG